MRNIWLLSIALLIPSPAAGQTGFLDQAVGTTCRYQVYVPSDYAKDGVKRGNRTSYHIYFFASISGWVDDDHLSLVGGSTPTPTPTPLPPPTPNASPTPTPTPQPAGSCKWFVAPNGSAANDGSINSPWTLQTVWNGNPNFGGTPPPSVIKPGDTVCLRGGNYSNAYRTYLLGTPSAPITVQAYPGERATVDGGGIMIDGGGNMAIRDIEFTYSNTLRTVYRAGGFAVAAPGIKIINCIIHDGGTGIASPASGYDDEFYGNVIYNVGWDDRSAECRPSQLPDFPDSPACSAGQHDYSIHQGGTGPGTYFQNERGFKKFYNNIITGSFGLGYSAYTAAHSQLAGFDVQNNISYNNGYPTRYLTSKYGTEGAADVNYLVGSSHVPLSGLIVTGNVGYHREQRYGDNLSVGYGGAQNADAVVSGNILLGGDVGIAGFQTLDFSGNTVATRLQAFYHRPGTVPTSEVLNNNNYYYFGDCNSTFISNDAGNNFITVAQWKALGYDANSTFYPCGTRPPLYVRIIPNAYDAKRAHFIVSNMSGAPTVSVSLSPFLNNGDGFEIRNAQDYYGPLVASGTYNGPVTISMNGLTVAVPVGYSTLSNVTPMNLMSSGPQFGAFVLIKK